jgi:hypothetical protein
MKLFCGFVYKSRAQHHLDEKKKLGGFGENNKALIWLGMF